MSPFSHIHLFKRRLSCGAHFAAILTQALKIHEQQKTMPPSEGDAFVVNAGPGLQHLNGFNFAI